MRDSKMQIKKNATAEPKGLLLTRMYGGKVKVFLGCLSTTCIISVQLFLRSSISQSIPAASTSSSIRHETNATIKVYVFCKGPVRKNYTMLCKLEGGQVDSPEVIAWVSVYRGASRCQKASEGVP